MMPGFGRHRALVPVLGAAVRQGPFHQGLAPRKNGCSPLGLPSPEAGGLPPGQQSPLSPLVHLLAGGRSPQKPCPSSSSQLGTSTLGMMGTDRQGAPP